MQNHADHARQLFLEGYNCAQAVACAFTDVTGLDVETSARMACSFGGGLGRLREVCGTVSGAAFVLGMACGYSDPRDSQAKTAHYHLIQRFAQLYREENGSIICRELLAGCPVKPGADPEERTPEYYKKRPCAGLVWYAAHLVDMLLDEQGSKSTREASL